MLRIVLSLLLTAGVQVQPRDAAPAKCEDEKRTIDLRVVTTR